MILPLLGAGIEEHFFGFRLGIDAGEPIPFKEVTGDTREGVVRVVIRASAYFRDDVFNMKRVAADFLGSLAIFAPAARPPLNPLARSQAAMGFGARPR